MKSKYRFCPLLLLITLVVSGSGSTVLLADTVYPVPTQDQLKTKLENWLKTEESVSEETLESIHSLWIPVENTEKASSLLPVLIRSLVLANSGFQNRLALANEVVHPDHPGFKEFRDELESAPDFARQNIALAIAIEFSRNNFFDEALALFELIQPQMIADPAGYFFFKAVCQQQLLKRKAALDSLSTLLEKTDGVPLRYRRVAELMKQQLEQMEEKSLDEIAHKMNDSERRLDLGRAGRRVQKVQEDIIDSLEELIKKKEQQQQQSSGGGGAAGGGSNNPGGQPAQESVIKGSKAPGEVDRKSLKKQGSWGDLPPKAEARARNLINRDFPSHYKQAIERYFKKLATRQAEE